jgi:hypothetical protein
VVVDHKASAHGPAGLESCSSLPGDSDLVLILDTKLDELSAHTNEANNPFGAVDNGIEGIETRILPPSERR